MPRSLFILLLAMMLTSCATLTREPQPPRVTVTHLEVTRVSLFAQHYRVGLQLQNPNDFDLPLSGLEFTLSLNETPFASGVSSTSVTLPRFGEADVDVEVTSNLLRLLEQTASASADSAPLRYALEGSVSVTSLGLRLPFDTTGELHLGAQAP